MNTAESEEALGGVLPRNSAAIALRAGWAKPFAASVGTSPAAASTDLMPARAPGWSSTPSVTAAGVNECPVPAIRTATD